MPPGRLARSRSGRPANPSRDRRAVRLPQHVPEGRPDRLGVVAERDERSVRAPGDWQLRQCPGGRPRDRLGAAEHVELALVAGADQGVLRSPVQPDRAAGVGTDLRVGDVPVGRPLGRFGIQLEELGFDPDEQRRRVRVRGVAVWKDREDAADRELGDLGRAPVRRGEVTSGRATTSRTGSCRVPAPARRPGSRVPRRGRRRHRGAPRSAACGG